MIPVRHSRRGLTLVLCMIAVAAILGGCATPPFIDPGEHARQLAARHGFSESHVDTGAFTLLVFHRGLDRESNRTVVYIEGDGRAYVSHRRVSADPTPRDPVALHMALVDPSPAVVYIARPCQYLESLSCEPRFWTTHRYAGAVVDAIDLAIDDTGKHAAGREYVLVGYSGGGVIAALLARRRTDVAWLVTVAAPLDHAAWTAYHGDTPLDGSLNPADAPASLADVPQLHLAGSRDTTVPPEVVQSFVDKLPTGSLAEYQLVSGMTHNGWPEQWHGLICEIEYWAKACKRN